MALLPHVVSYSSSEGFAPPCEGGNMWKQCKHVQTYTYYLQSNLLAMASNLELLGGSRGIAET